MPRKPDKSSIFNRPIRRRDALKMLAGAGAAAATAVLPARAPAVITGKRVWKMVMSWHKVLPGLGMGAVRLAERITRMTEGKIEVKAYGGGELVPPLGVFDAVSEGSAELGHSSPYYWLSKSRSSAFFCTVPGGLTSQEQNAWIYFGGGLKLWHELYAPFNLIAFPAGNTGVQMGGWFRKELNSIEDIKGLKMRIPGIAGEVISKLGGLPQNIPAQELFTSLQSGVIDALEWVGPWNDMAMGFHRIAKFYYGPGFHEGGPALELMINKTAYDSLSPDLQKIIKVACAAENMLMESEYIANNNRAMRDLKKNHPDVKVQSYPEDILKAVFSLSEEAVAETATLGDINRRIYESYSDFRSMAMEMAPVTEYGFLRGRLMGRKG